MKENLNIWRSVTTDYPPKNTVIETKIDDEKGERNRATLKHDGNLWWFPDGSMYVYYVPTHWRYMGEEE